MVRWLQVLPAGWVLRAIRKRVVTDGTRCWSWFVWGGVVDSVGYVYVADTDNHRIRKINPAGTVTTFAGSTQGYADRFGTVARAA
ncbi:hypothetical protein FACS1894200_06000 [Spirochaetia bacterium]|nr:hypothetical protein FACS1894200_06000 [Spirochaetia bacterium]